MYCVDITSLEHFCAVCCKQIPFMSRILLSRIPTDLRKFDSRVIFVEYCRKKVCELWNFSFYLRFKTDITNTTLGRGFYFNNI